MKDRLKLGGVAGRHDIPNINGYVLDKVDDPADIEKINSDVKESLDKLNLGAGLDLYVTGLTSVTIAVIKYCFDNDVALTCYHFDMVSKTYLPQIVR